MGVFAGPDISESGLVLALDAGNLKSYNAGISTTTWTDLSGNGNTGTLTNGPTYSSANGGSLVFGSTNDYAELSASSSFNFSTGNFSIECWFNISGNSGLNGNGVRDACLFNCGNITNVNIIFLHLVISGDSSTTGTGFYLYKNQGGVVGQTQTVSISQNAWHQVVVSKIGTSLNFYLDNSQVGSTITDSNAWGSSTSNSRIATLNSTGSYADNFQGSISVVRIYNGKGLTAAEIQQNFNALRGRFGI